MPETRTLMTGLVFPESPHWHDNRLWVADWGAQELIAVDLQGASEVIASVPSFPYSFDWLPDGRLVIVSQVRDVSCFARKPDRWSPMPT